ncbi:hypothetical protein SFRURICE_015657 [Spodoptera frugiperda]|nr:hypothetical protein SFRURICE_015657 [Spodoptera frugiperda]
MTREENNCFVNWEKAKFYMNTRAEGRGGPRAEEQAATSEPPLLRLAKLSRSCGGERKPSATILRGPPEPRSSGAVTETMLACMLHACLHAACLLACMLLACLHAACLLACCLLACLHAACLLFIEFITWNSRITTDNRKPGQN